ncbi:hypothetical protein EG328_005877 [Venturia inaequalis]|uniref:Uncharacterized protein n=1 Tax=Venturia inaequalis TaxID=5025 RepID=A0A8H3VG93_VENIN|nr:hypothetical protein EG328_005877 [Venturia inaequalis]
MTQSPQPLVPFEFRPLPLGSIKPQGWLKDQMQLMASGLAGHEHDFYRFVSESSWLGGGSEYSKLNEGFPYWLNGIVPLAYGMDDERLKDQIRQSVQIVLQRRASDGWIGPEKGGARNFWARYPLFLGMIQLLEADSSYKSSILPALHDFVALQNKMLKNDYEGYLERPGDALTSEDHGWGRVRVADMMITLQWLYEHDPAGQEVMLMENLDYLRRGQIDWAEWYKEGVYIKEDFSTIPDEKLKPIFPYAHGVNVGQGLKAGAVINRFTNNASLLTMSRRAVDWTFTYHGATSGTILADERLKGLAPYYGSELCTTVETMYSLTYLYQTLGDSSFADRVELAAFNALPVALTPDWWAHQYLTQPNQPAAKYLSETPWWNVNGWGNTYGLEPNYPCCTVNHPQGYPKFLSGMFVGVGENGLAHALLGPGRVEMTLPSGAAVKVSCLTNYPFSNAFTYTVDSSAPFEFGIRIPGWHIPSPSSTIKISTTSPSGHISAKSVSISPDAHSGLQTLPLSTGTSTITLTLSHTINIIPRANSSIAIQAGPLLYALQIPSYNTSTAVKAFDQAGTANPFSPTANATNTTNSSNPTPASPLSPSVNGAIPPEVRDYQYLPQNGAKWAIAIDPSTLSFHSKFRDQRESGIDTEQTEPNLRQAEPSLPNPLWTGDGEGMPTWIEAKGCEIAWDTLKGGPGPVPAAGERKCLGEGFAVKLIPYGGAKVHMSEFPTVELGGGKNER